MLPINVPLTTIRKMSSTQLNAVLRKYTGMDEEAIQNATWEEIDRLSQEKSGSKPTFQRSPGLFYAGSPYVMTDRFGSLEESRDRWNKIGEE